MRLLGVILIAAFLAGAGGEAGAMVSGAPKISPPVKGEGVRKEPEMKKSPAPANSVRRVTKKVEKIEGGFLYTETGRYSLAGVQVLDMTRSIAGAGREGMPQKTAEMTFVNNQLKEVVIRQRQ
jgi:hypothetical protein